MKYLGQEGQLGEGGCCTQGAKEELSWTTWWEEERFEEESQAEHRRCLHPGQETRPGGKEKGTIGLKGKTWEKKEAEDECQAAVVHHGLPQDVS